MTSASKTELRKEARARRAVLPDIAEALASHAAALAFQPGTIVGGYHALKGEADPALLLKALVAQACHVAFPRIVGRDTSLTFHLVPDGEMLRPGSFGIHEPQADWPTAIPHVLLVPLLAFDSRGHRLGHGGGYYDRTLDAFRRWRPGAIGIGHSQQQIASLPDAPHDMALDGILTEQGLRLFR